MSFVEHHLADPGVFLRKTEHYGRCAIHILCLEGHCVVRDILVGSYRYAAVSVCRDRLPVKDNCRRFHVGEEQGHAEIGGAKL